MSGQNLETICKPDWVRMELEYIQGTKTVAEVLLAHGVSPTSGSSTAKTAGWSKKRADFRQKIREEKLAEAVEAGKDALTSMDLALFKLAHAVMPALAAYMRQKGCLNPKEVETILHMVLLRTDQPTTIGKHKVEADKKYDEQAIEEYLRKFCEDV